MCVIACKYLKNYGWVGVKNRDRNYKPTISFNQDSREGTEATYIMDEITKYSEGINEYGLCIINAATTVKNDESESARARLAEKNKSKSAGTYKAPDGIVLRHALRFKDPKKSAEYLISKRFMGHTLVFNKEECWILEGGGDEKEFKENMKQTKLDPDFEWEEMTYVWDLKKIDKTDYIVRTNHGHFLPWIGYQKNSDDEATLKSRKSSEARHKTAVKNLRDAETPDEMLVAISDLSNKDPQLNPLRIDDYKNRKLLKTTGQICLIPKNLELIYVPIWCNTDASDFDKVNSRKTKTAFTLKAFNPDIEEGVLDSKKVVEESAVGKKGRTSAKEAEKYVAKQLAIVESLKKSVEAIGSEKALEILDLIKTSKAVFNVVDLIEGLGDGSFEKWYMSEFNDYLLDEGYINKSDIVLFISDLFKVSKKKAEELKEIFSTDEFVEWYNAVFLKYMSDELSYDDFYNKTLDSGIFGFTEDSEQEVVNENDLSNISGEVLNEFKQTVNKVGKTVAHEFIKKIKLNEESEQIGAFSISDVQILDEINALIEESRETYRRFASGVDERDFLRIMKNLSVYDSMILSVYGGSEYFIMKTGKDMFELTEKDTGNVMQRDSRGRVGISRQIDFDAITLSALEIVQGIVKENGDVFKKKDVTIEY